MQDRKPVIVRCPICQPGPYSFAGVIIAQICAGCLRIKWHQE